MSTVQWLLANDGTARVALILGVALLAGLARGFSGFGAALIFVPLGSMLVGPKQAASVLAIVDIIFAAHLIPAALKQADVREVGLMFLGALVGLPLGAAVLTNFEPLTLRWLISILALAMLLLLLSAGAIGDGRMQYRQSSSADYQGYSQALHKSAARQW